MRKNSSLFPCLQESGPVSAPETEGLYNDSQLSWLEVQLVHARHDFTFRFHRQTLSLTPWPFSSWFLGIASTTCSSMNCLFSFSVLILTWYKVKKILLWIPVWEWTHVMCFKDLKPRRKKPDTTFNDFHWRGLNGIDCSKNSWPLLRNEKKCDMKHLWSLKECFKAICWSFMKVACCTFSPSNAFCCPWFSSLVSHWSLSFFQIQLNSNTHAENCHRKDQSCILNVGYE